jgi:transcriptional regulator with XRE-family HTH domain
MTGTTIPSDPDHRVTRAGPRLRAIRRQRRLTIEEVAARAGLSKGFVSRLERADASVSLSALLRICDILGVTIGSLFDDVHEGPLRGGDAPALDYGGADMEHLMLTPASLLRFQVVKSVIKPQGGAGEEEYTWPGEAEFVHVTEGELELEIEGDSHTLAQGDSLTFSPRAPHTYRNPSARRRSVALWVISPAP